MEPQSSSFEREAFRAAGPVFLLSLGAVILAVLLVTALFSPLPGPIAWTLFAAGVGALVVGFAWIARPGRRARGAGE